MDMPVCHIQLLIINTWCEVEREIKIERKADRQTDRQTDVRSSSVCSFFLSVSSFFWSLAWCPWRRIVCSLVSSSEVSENSSGFWRPGGGGRREEKGGMYRRGGRGRKEREGSWKKRVG